MMLTLTHTLRFAASILPLSVLLVSCGGTDGGASVLNLSAAGVKYNSTMTVTVSGRLLGDGITMTSDKGCVNIVMKTGGTNESVDFTCKLTAAGDVFVRVRNAANDTIGSLRVEVPQPRMTIATNQGTFVVELDPGKAPVSVANFATYVAANFYTSTIFHRVIADQLIEGGSYLAGPKAKLPNLDPIILESNNGLKNQRGTIAMVRVDGQPNSATSGFFINTQDNPAFDRQNDENPGYAVFGTVVSGLDVVDTIKAVATRSVTLDGAGLVLPNVPVTDVRITSITQTQ